VSGLAPLMSITCFSSGVYFSLAPRRLTMSRSLPCDSAELLEPRIGALSSNFCLEATCLPASLSFSPSSSSSAGLAKLLMRFLPSDALSSSPSPSSPSPSPSLSCFATLAAARLLFFACAGACTAGTSRTGELLGGGVSPLSRLMLVLVLVLVLLPLPSASSSSSSSLRMRRKRLEGGPGVDGGVSAVFLAGNGVAEADATAAGATDAAALGLKNAESDVCFIVRAKNRMGNAQCKNMSTIFVAVCDLLLVEKDGGPPQLVQGRRSDSRVRVLSAA